MPSTHGLKKGGTWPIYWPFKATKFDWNVQTLTFSEWNTWSVKALMELMAASFFGATSPATLPKQKPWSWRCTGCMNWYKGWRVRTRMSLEINLFIKNQWQDLIAVTCVLIRKRYRQEKKIGGLFMHYFKHWKLVEIMIHTKIQSYHHLEEMLYVMNDTCFHLASLCSPVGKSTKQRF